MRSTCCLQSRRSRVGAKQLLYFKATVGALLQQVATAKQDLEQSTYCCLEIQTILVYASAGCTVFLGLVRLLVYQQGYWFLVTYRLSRSTVRRVTVDLLRR